IHVFHSAIVTTEEIRIIDGDDTPILRACCGGQDTGETGARYKKQRAFGNLLETMLEIEGKLLGNKRKNEHGQSSGAYNFPYQVTGS
ncbi:hypothetical protein, partial [Roseibium sp.]|uniref:hypothetical protein n=1 Tax=Roseibium sp. TaxID=1936156 RepID=UPI001B1D690F